MKKLFILFLLIPSLAYAAPPSPPPPPGSFSGSYNDLTDVPTNIETFSGITPSANIQELLGAADYATARSDLSVYSSSEVDSALAAQDACGEITGCPANAAAVVTYFSGGTCSGYLKSDGTCDTPAGSDVSKVGTPVDNQVGTWTGDGTIEGDVDLTFDTTGNTLSLAGNGGTSILSVGGVNVLVDNPRGTATLSNIDALDATSTTTVAAAVASTYSAGVQSILDDADVPAVLTTLGVDDAVLADGTVPLTAGWDVGAFDVHALTFTSDQTTGTAPFTVASTTTVTNLSSDFLDGISSGGFYQKGGDNVSLADGGCNSNSASECRTNLSLVPGTNIQAFDAGLLSLAGLSETNGGIPYGTGNNAYAWLAAGTAGYLLQGNGVGAPSWTSTLAVTAADFGAGVFEVPNGTSGTTDATGEIYLDTNGDGGTNFSGPVVQVYTGAANAYMFPIALPLAATQDDYIPKYDAATKTISWEADSVGAGNLGADFTSSVNEISVDEDVSAKTAIILSVTNAAANNEKLSIDLATTADTVTLGTSTGLDTLLSFANLYLGSTSSIASDGDGALTFASHAGGQDEDLTMNLDDTADTVVFSSSTGVTDLDYGSFNINTTGVIKGRASYGSDITGAVGLNTTDLHGVFYHFTAAATATLDAAADAGYGAQACFRARDDSEAYVVDVQAGEKINLDGTALAAGTAITTSSVGSTVCMVATTDADGSGTDGWETWGNNGWASE